MWVAFTGNEFEGTVKVVGFPPGTPHNLTNLRRRGYIILDVQRYREWLRA